MDLQRVLETPASWAVAATNVVFFLIAQSHGDTRVAENLIRYGALDRGRIWKAGESWRLLTAMFLHVGWMHLAMNTYFMLGWCRHVEQELGTISFVLAYLMTGIGAGAVSVLGHRAVSAGASGAGFGMIGVALMIRYRDLGSWNGFFADPYATSTLIQAGIWIVLGIFVIRFLDNWAHGGGLVFGLLGGYALTLNSEHDSRLRIPALVLIIGVWIAVVLASLSPRFARNPRDPDQLF